MAKNYAQDGKTIPLVNSGATDVHSGDPVVVGKLIAVAITDIPVYLKDGKITIEETDAVAAGIAWEDAAANTTVVEVKINA